MNRYCCHFCFSKSGQMFLDRMILCHECGNKRCPKATSHELPCTNSNEPNQDGSIYTAPPQRKPLTDEEIYDMYNEPRSDAEMIAFARAVEEAVWKKNS